MGRAGAPHTTIETLCESVILADEFHVPRAFSRFNPERISCHTDVSLTSWTPHFLTTISDADIPRQSCRCRRALDAL
jgi:hypothetical protein